jgi:hypothetical protein
VGIILHNIRIRQGRQDYETGLDVMTLLVKTWELAKQFKSAHACELVIDNLRHNILANGGCYPGIAARLVQPYTVLLQEAYWHRAKKSQNNSASTGLYTPQFADVTAALSEEEAIALAKALSLSITPASDTTQPNNLKKSSIEMV